MNPFQRYTEHGVLEGKRLLRTYKVNEGQVIGKLGVSSRIAVTKVGYEISTDLC